MGVKGRTFNDSSEYYSERIRMLEKELEESNEKNKNYMEANEKLKDEYRIARNEIDLLNMGNKELREQVKFHKQKYDMAIATPTPTAAFEEEIKQLKDKVVLWKKDAEKSKEEAQKFREQYIEEATMKEKYSYELEVMASFYEAEKERAKTAEAESQKLLEELKKEKENSEYFSEKAMKCNEDIKRKESELTWIKRELEDEVSASKTLKSVMNSKESEIRKLNDEVQKWKNAYSEEFKSKAEISSAVISADHIVTGTLEVAEDFKLPEVFAVMRCKAEDPELFSNPVEAIERTEQLNEEKDAYSIHTIRILKVK